MGKVVMGVFNDYASAAAAIEELKNEEFTPDEISLVGRQTDEMIPLASGLATHEPDRFVTTLAIAGAVIGFLCGLFTIYQPGIGALTVAGPLLAAICGAAAGTALGVIAGMFVHFDVPEYESRVYEGNLTRGKTLVAVRTEQLEERFRAERVFDRFGAIEVDTKAA